jgi:hypothetical protein
VEWTKADETAAALDELDGLADERDEISLAPNSVERVLPDHSPRIPQNHAERWSCVW